MPKRVLNGVVCSANNQKTVVVRVERLLKHPIYKKYIKKYKKCIEINEKYKKCIKIYIKKYKKCIKIH